MGDKPSGLFPLYLISIIEEFLHLTEQIVGLVFLILLLSQKELNPLGWVGDLYNYKDTLQTRF